ncbi:carboxypeptidase-like regulatory domain-containing protein [Algibacter sp. L1A34]|uniref:carboxypeptidase-like regulatory domain-containing protein n=1 Tax=Algibacter sp. L1A34 TaxID=2686365 RepID=UPI00131B0168|nr:carboxypeptidase-like regulatory domain-containing protein [Algibacter sp. L1A34]
MKTQSLIKIIVLSVLIVFTSTLMAQSEKNAKEIKGRVVDYKTNSPLTFTNFVISGTNISTVSNSDGEFVLKIPETSNHNIIIVSRLGYETKKINISELNKNSKIKLIPAITTLNEISINVHTNPEALVRATLSKKSTLYNNSNTLMTAFYRETIKKRRKNASLSEAVVQIHKQPYNSLKRDAIELVKARKSTDYTKLDTLALKLQGGPFSNLYTDIIKYPEYIFTDEDMPLYEFSFDTNTQVNNQQIYVVNFKQKPNIITPLYYGKLYIDSETLALTNAVYSLNVENKELSSKMYIRKKPRKVDVYPTQATYRVNYRTQNGKWHYAYSNISLTFKVNWKGKLFNSIYTLNSEMAITDWEEIDTKIAKSRERTLRPTTILADEASGFSDPRFWGEYNIIEPEKSIESAIKKIQKQLKRT